MGKQTTIEKLWKIALFEPKGDQPKAIQQVKGPLLLTAGPGSGKTRVLLWRTLNLIVFNSVDPKRIFLSTFTEKAAHQLTDGLRYLLGVASNETDKPYDISGMSIGTVHSICHRIVSDRKLNRHATGPTILMEAFDQFLYLHESWRWKELAIAAGFENGKVACTEINAYFGKESESRPQAVDHCVALFNRFSEECLDPGRIKTRDNLLSKMIKMYASYLKHLKADMRADLSLIQQEALRVIESLPNGYKLYDHIIIDEYQDTNTIQEKLFFALARGSRNICVVGDDDQALYRFRGATVENLVEFEDRCKKALGARPSRLNLNINFRSRRKIVEFYTDYIEKINWMRKGRKGGYYRLMDKKIMPNSKDDATSVLVTEHADAEDVYAEVAEFVEFLMHEKKITDYNQVAFLFPSMMSNSKVNTRVEGFHSALIERGIPVYAPRAGSFLEVNESLQVFGLMMKLFDRPEPWHDGFREWSDRCVDSAQKLIKSDGELKKYVEMRTDELKKIRKDYQILIKYQEKQGWDGKTPCTIAMYDSLGNCAGLSDKARKSLKNRYVRGLVQKRVEDGKPFSLRYIVDRAASVDWSLLDLFYQFCGFKEFRKGFVSAETGGDDEKVCNLSALSRHIGRFMELRGSMITARILEDNMFGNRFFNSYLYALYRRREGLLEDEDQVFPKGHVPFLTIHQAKGLEFPIVVLGSVYKQDWGASLQEKIVRDLLKRQGEPLDRIGEFDIARMFYVGLSRAKNLLILPRYTKGRASIEPFTSMLSDPKLGQLSEYNMADLSPVKSQNQDEDFGATYSYTGDYLWYGRCAKQYMVFRKYGFLPSRSQTMFFGSLVHRTIEDLHNHLIRMRTGNE